MEAGGVVGSGQAADLLVGREGRQEGDGGALGVVGGCVGDIRGGGAVDGHGVGIVACVERQRLYVNRGDGQEGRHVHGGVCGWRVRRSRYSLWVQKGCSKKAVDAKPGRKTKSTLANDTCKPDLLPRS